MYENFLRLTPDPGSSPCFFKAILTKNVEWKAIPHTKELKLEK